MGRIPLKLWPSYPGPGSEPTTHVGETSRMAPPHAQMRHA